MSSELEKLDNRANFGFFELVSSLLVLILLPKILNVNQILHSIFCGYPNSHYFEALLRYNIACASSKKIYQRINIRKKYKLENQLKN